MKIPVEEKLEIKDGMHEGVIIKTEYRVKPFKYTDIVVQMKAGEDKHINLKAGYPTIVQKESKLGQLLQRFGISVAVGQDVDPDDLIGKPCKFLTMTEKTGRGEFAKILPDSVKPL